MISYEMAVDKASRLLHYSVDDAVRHSEVLPDAIGFRFWVPSRGGGVILMDLEGAVLFANSSLNDDEHLRLFLEGKRTPEELFS